MTDTQDVARSALGALMVCATEASGSADGGTAEVWRDSAEPFGGWLLWLIWPGVLDRYEAKQF